MIIPAIMEKEYVTVERKISLVKDWCRWIQIDVVDGVFESGKTFELELLTRSDLDLSNQLFDIHLLTKEPENWIEKSVFVGASRVTGQVELMSDRERFVNLVKEAGLEAGLGFDIDTELSVIPEDTDVVLLMGRKAGFTNYPLSDMLWEKISKLRQIREAKGLKFQIGVDGAISRENIGDLKKSGVDIFYCTSAIFNGNVEVNITTLKNAINQ